jgi:nucleoside-diphosphate-sugar epimerase
VQNLNLSRESSMKVLLIGATGNVGIRLVPALLSHVHIVIADVRSPPKLASLLPPFIHSQITVIKGSATDSTAIKEAIQECACEAVINAAGVAALAP